MSRKHAVNVFILGLHTRSLGRGGRSRRVCWRSTSAGKVAGQTPYVKELFFGAGAVVS